MELPIIDYYCEVVQVTTMVQHQQVELMVCWIVFRVGSKTFSDKKNGGDWSVELGYWLDHRHQILFDVYG